jgi:hypothetical protein
MAVLDRSECWVRTPYLLQAVMTLIIAYALACPSAKGQGAAPAGPVPAPGVAPPLSPFNVDSSSKIIVNYNIGPFANNRFPVSNGQISDDSKLVINASSALPPPSPIFAYLTLTVGQAAVQIQPLQISGLTWNANQYTATNAQLADFAKVLVDAINGMLGGFDANHGIPPISATVSLALAANVPAKNSSPVGGHVTISFQPVAGPLPEVARQQSTTASQQAAVAKEQSGTAKLQTAIAQVQAIIAQQQQTCEKEQAAVAKAQAAAGGANQPAAVVQAQKALASKHQDEAVLQVAIAAEQVAATELQVSITERQVAGTVHQLDLARQQIATAPASQATVAAQQGSVAQQQNVVAQGQNKVAQQQNAVAQAQSTAAKGQAAVASAQSAAAH